MILLIWHAGAEKRKLVLANAFIFGGILVQFLSLFRHHQEQQIESVFVIK